MRTENFFAILLIAVLMAGCSNDDDTMEPIADPDANYFVSVDPNNNLLLRVNRDDGIVVSYYGEKNELGRAVKYTSTVVERAGEAPVFLNMNSGPTRAFSPAGSLEVIPNEWLSPSLYLKYNNGQNNLLVGSTELMSFGSFMVSSETPPHKDLESPESRQMQDYPSCSEDNLLVRIESCGEAVTNENLLALLLKPVGLEGASIMVGQRVGNNLFCFYVPRSPEVELSSMCLSVEMALRIVCNGSKPSSNFCGKLDELSIAGGMSSFEECELLSSAFDIACETLKASTGEDDVLHSTCRAKVLEEEMQAFPDELQVEPTLIFKGGKTRIMEPITVSAPYNELVIDLTEESGLANISIAGDLFINTYDLKLFFECLAEPTTVSISVEGPDGFTLTKEQVVEAGSSTVVFVVPTREILVTRDVVNIDVEGIGSSQVLVGFSTW